MTSDYYANYAEEFCRETLSLDMGEIRIRFIHYLPSKAIILDAGCGSGRDTVAFKEMGYSVVAFDASPEIARIASRVTGQEVMPIGFEDLEFKEDFDGVWACASLLHVPREDLPSALEKLVRALKPGGYLYMSFKEGRTERVDDKGRFFQDLDKEGLDQLLLEVTDLEIIEWWTTKDLRPERKEGWLNVILRKAK